MAVSSGEGKATPDRHMASRRAGEQGLLFDTQVSVPPEDVGKVNEVVLNQQPRVSIWLVNADGARAVEHGYRFLRLL